MQKQKTKVLKEKENLGFGLRTMRCHLTYYQVQNLYGSHNLQGSCCVCTSAFSSRVAWRSLATAKCVLRGFEQPASAAPWVCAWNPEGIDEVQQGPLMSEALESGLPHLLSILSAKHNLCSVVFKIRVWMASQERQCCSEQHQRGGVLVNAWDLSEMLLDAPVKPYTWMRGSVPSERKVHWYTYCNM